MNKTLKAVALAAGLTLLMTPAASYASVPHDQWVKKGSSWTYYNATGKLQKGWLHWKNQWYYLDANGIMKTGWVSIGGKRYYFNSSGVMQTGWVKSGNNWYYFESSGAMKTGWLNSGPDTYYLNVDGTMKTGWLQLAGKWYFFNRISGKMKLGENIIDGKMYFFYLNSGIMATNTTYYGSIFGPDGYRISDKEAAVESIYGFCQAYYGVGVQYDKDTNYYNLYKDYIYDFNHEVGSFKVDGEVFGGTYAWGQNMQPMLIKIALLLGAPSTQDELQKLVDESQVGVSPNGIVTTKDIYIYNSSTQLQILWGPHKPSQS